MAAFVAVLVALLPAGLLAASGAVGRNGPGGPQGSELVLGSLTVTASQACTVAYSLQVQTESGSGDDTFELQLYDDGALIQIATLRAPADGALHTLAGTLQLGQSVSQANPGVGVYLVDSAASLDFVDPAPVTCGAVEIPTIDTVGAFLLGGLLLASALLVLRRSRRPV
jgi:hypothetical protein